MYSMSLCASLEMGGARNSHPGPVSRCWKILTPISKLAHKLMEYMPTQHKEAVQGGVVGGIVGSILDGMK